MNQILLLTLTVLFLGTTFDVIPQTYRRDVTYEGHKVFRCNFPDRLDSDSLWDLVHAFGLDVWTQRPNGEIDVRVTKQQLEESTFLHRYFKENCEILVDDVEELIAKSEREWQLRPKTDEWFEEYHTYDEIVDWYEALSTQYPALTSWNPSIGNSYQGRAQPALHITSEEGGNNKLRIYFQCQIHAREWISGAVCQYVVNYLLTSYGQNSNVTELLDSLEFVIVPFTNPDGYAYTWNGDRLWRKNRQPNSGSTCAGTDLNRNYNSHWGQGGSSTNPCSETYMGPSVASAPEVQNTANYFKSQSTGVIGAIDFHSYGQLILRPWGYTSANSPHETFLKSVGDGMRAVILSNGGVAYTSQKSIQLYVTTGTASDWFYDTDATNSNKGYRAAGFTIELRDTGAYGFILPPAQIIPNGAEITHAVTYFAQRVLAAPIEV